MAVILFPGKHLGDVKHPGRGIGYDEMQARGICDPLDPNAPMPSKCSRCGVEGSMRNPLMAFPISGDMKDMAKALLYRALCHDCRVLTMPRKWRA